MTVALLVTGAAAIVLGALIIVFRSAIDKWNESASAHLPYRRQGVAGPGNRPDRLTRFVGAGCVFVIGGVLAVAVAVFSTGR